MNKKPGLKPGKIIFISKSFRSHDGFLLIERFMCVLKIETDNILLLPMSTFHSETIRKRKLTYKNVFEYAKSHGNTRDAYIKCDQIYSLSIDDFNGKGIKPKHQMDKEHFKKLKNQVRNLQKENKTNFLFKEIIFEDSLVLKQKDQDSETIFTNDELARMEKDEQKFIERFKKAEAALKKSQQVVQEAEDSDNEFDGYER
ncbi:hypothetical protein LT336_00451 [Spiroplasma sp. JKS002671]|uniref:hypothetical protein n=1 Tax=Spiroplasma attinicola TaxID=2904537 RepID=UPI0020229ED7|nr:hypothetical protein [Spiroplasma sp. JKS002671]MCL8210707.1 hypothetical protein [Spiroplasma sp. JKS002671]